ncbi:MAG: C4-dicarboxylic acid transporter DauA [Stenotrophomonas maltophilia]|nr:MAG: C4-dicarboxylic acid transporter DauA [Stenotrophomonas maltophilia]
MRRPEPGRWLPFLAWLPRVDRRTLNRDLWVGLSGAVLALPQSMAYALIAGLPAEYGLYAAMLPVVIASLWGSSWYMVGGPTAAISVVLYAAVAPLATPGSAAFIEYALLLTFLAGLFQYLLGVLRFGVLVNFVSHSVVLGFTGGAALVIAIGQLPYWLGIHLNGQGTALGNALALVRLLPAYHAPSLLLGAFCLLLSLGLRRVWPRGPALLLGLIGSSALAWVWPALFGQVERVQALRSALPPFSPLHFELAAISQLLPAAVACGMLGLVTSLSIARALASRTHQPLDANQEVRAQGLSNLIGPWFSGSLSAGSFTRSGLNLDAGARSPLAGVFSALWVALLALAGAGLIQHIPLPAMAAGILLICWNLVDRRALRALWRGSRAEFLVMLLTLAATLLLPLQNAIYAGVLASLFFYLKRTSQPRVEQWWEGPAQVLRVEGSIFFGACDYLQRRMQQCAGERLVLDAQHVNFIDFAGAQMLLLEARRLAGEGRELALRNLRPRVQAQLARLTGNDASLRIEAP